MYSCTNESVEEQSGMENVEEVQMQELIRYTRELRLVQSDSSESQTRNSLKSLRKWFKKIGKADAGGYRWARDLGMNVWNSLKVGAAASFTAAIGGDDARVQWRVNDEWKVYPTSIRDYEELGNAHNQIVYELYHQNSSFRPNSSISNAAILSDVQIKAKELGYDGSFTTIQRTGVLEMLEDLRATFKVSDNLTPVFTKRFPSSNSEYVFLDEYLETILALSSRQEMLATTKQVYSKIDSLSNVKKSLLKDMVSIALCSVNLWQQQ